MLLILRTVVSNDFISIRLCIYKYVTRFFNKNITKHSVAKKECKQWNG